MRCAVSECYSRFKGGIRSHNFPSDPALKQKWLEILKIKNPLPCDRVCSLHFLQSDYKQVFDSSNADAIIRKNLKAFTLPSQNLPATETDRQKFQRNPLFAIKKITFSSATVSEPNLGKTNADSQQSIDFENFSIFNYVVKDESGFKLNFDNDIGEEECRYYLKLFPAVNAIREKKTHCTSCNIHLGCAPKTEAIIRMHPILKVTLCKKCFEFYNSGEFSKGEDGSELYCRWCGQGGEVYCCAKCPYVFCKGCISLNLSKNLVNDIQENENWNCFVCAPKITWPVRAAHWALMNFLRKQKQYIMNGDHSEVQKRNLMRKDVSQCCPERRSQVKECDEEDDDIPLAKTIKASTKRKLSDTSDSGSAVKIAAIAPQITGRNNLTIQSATKKIKSDPIATRPTIIPGSQPNKQFVLNNQIIFNQVTPQQAQIAKTTPPSHVGQVKIVQMPTQSSNLIQKLPTVQQQQQRLPMIQPRLPIIQQKLPSIQPQSQPPPLLIRNRGVQIRPTNLLANPRPTVSTARTTGEQTPVYHTIGGYCIDLNSAAQHDSIRLPNGKLIQVKKSTTSNTLSNANGRNQNGSSQAQLVSPQQQHHFTITQPAYPLQTAAAPAPIVSNVPPTTGTIHVVNGNQIQIPLQIQQNNTTMIPQQQQQQQQGPRPPILIKHVFNQTQIGKARSQLQNQIFTAMEICQHLSGKIQTLTNSNPYKNAATLGDVKELYIHLSYLFTYAIGRFKTVQEKCNEDMKNIGYRADHTKLVKGHLAAEKEQTSDTEEGELELIEPQTTTIDLDSDNEDNLASTSGINSQQISTQAVAEANSSNLTEEEEQDYNLSFDLLAGMLEVNLTEDSHSLSNFNKPKHPRKKTTSRPNPALLKQQQEKYEQIKQNDLKLKQKCNILIEYFDLSKSQIQSAMERYCKQQDKDDGLNVDDVATDDQINYESQYELLNMLQVEVNDEENQSKEKENSCDDEDHANETVDDSTGASSKKDEQFVDKNKENNVIDTDNEHDSDNTSVENKNQQTENDLNKKTKLLEVNTELGRTNHSSDSMENENLENSNIGESSKSENQVVEQNDENKTDYDNETNNNDENNDNDENNNNNDENNDNNEENDDNNEENDNNDNNEENENNDNNEENDNNDNNEENKNNDNNEENDNNEGNENIGNEIINSENCERDVTDDSIINISDDVEMNSLENKIDHVENEIKNKSDVSTDSTKKNNETKVHVNIDCTENESKNKTDVNNIDATENESENKAHVNTDSTEKNSENKADVNTDSTEKNSENKADVNTDSTEKNNEDIVSEILDSLGKSSNN